MKLNRAVAGTNAPGSSLINGFADPRRPRTTEANMTSYEPYAALAGRLLLSLIFIISGFEKLGNYSGTLQEIQSAGLPIPTIAYIVAVVVEVAGGLAILVGFKARWVGAAMCLYTLAAALSFHAHFGDQNQTIHFMKNVAIAGGFLYVVAFGAGAISVDEWRSAGQKAGASRT
jgi:putative oxidoreductase